MWREWSRKAYDRAQQPVDGGEAQHEHRAAEDRAQHLEALLRGAVISASSRALLRLSVPVKYSCTAASAPSGNARGVRRVRS